jgi:DNA-binding MarR family transcriptional regulator
MEVMMLIDDILELKKRCDFIQQIGSTYDLSEREVDCMFKIASHEDITSKDLSQLLGLSPSRGSRVVSRLVQRGFIEVSHDDQDRRSYKLSLSDNGKACYQDILQQKNLCEQRLTEQLTDSQRETVMQGLGLLMRVI